MKSKIKQIMNPTLSGLTLFMLLVPLMVFAQNDEKFIGEVRVMNVVEAECTRKDGIYEIRFRDVKKRRFPKYKSFHFPNENKNYFKLKEMVLKGFDSIPEDPQLLDFTDEKVEVQFRKSAGLTSFRFALGKEGKNKKVYSSWLVKGKAEKLFGI